MTGEEWTRILLALGILSAMFVFPIVTLWRDERRKRRQEAEAAQDSAAPPAR